MPRWLDGVQEFAFTARSGVLPWSVQDSLCITENRMICPVQEKFASLSGSQGTNRHATGMRQEQPGCHARVHITLIVHDYVDQNDTECHSPSTQIPRCLCGYCGYAQYNRLRALRGGRTEYMLGG